jgi:hypothetical protein
MEKGRKKERERKRKGGRKERGRPAGKVLRWAHIQFCLA